MRRAGVQRRHPVACFFWVPDSAAFGADFCSAEQAQPVSRLQHFTKAFHHFFQKPGTPAVSAFVVVIAFQGFWFIEVSDGGKDIQSFAPLAQSSKVSAPAPRLALG
jgi:hypothetical protein